MTKSRYRFYKEKNKWYIDIHNWEGPKDELVISCDKVLDIISNGDTEMFITFTNKKFNGSDELIFIESGSVLGPENGEGSWYYIPSYLGISLDIKFWVSDVLEMILGGVVSERVYFRKGL